MKKFFAALLVVGVLAGGCASKDALTALDVSGQTLLTTANTFNAAAISVYFPSCLPQAAPGYEKFCAGMKKFAPRFDENFGRAYSAWQIAIRANDAAAAKGAEATVIQLATELAALSALIILEEVK